MATTFDGSSRICLLPEWAPQDAVLIAWPHRLTDWAPMLDEITRCYLDITRQLVALRQRVLIVSPQPAEVGNRLDTEGIDREAVTLVDIPTNDTWTRDYGPLTVTIDGMPCLSDFTFNAWGMKFAANLDNQVNRLLDRRGCFAAPLLDNSDMVLEGGSVETDGCGTLLTTARCLLSVNRNDHWSRADIEWQLRQRLGIARVLWLEHGYLPGDDTDSHVDTLARMAPDDTIVYATARPDAEEAAELRLMRGELEAFRTTDGRPYRLLPLPAPRPIVDEDGCRLPATYANYLVVNGAVLVPSYGQPDNDSMAVEVIARAFPGRHVVGVDCRPLIKQHGSLHCATMQLPQSTLKL